MIKMRITVLYFVGKMMWEQLNESLFLEGTQLHEGREIRVNGGKTMFGVTEQSEKK